ncbi:MAG: class A beta-lactamase-related serine hydrolase [Candidatus Omnitrophica bacterium]|nr:class A beta-lactamase-related serine hydrolase [Candidatus Omnitrophota bacterium]
MLEGKSKNLFISIVFIIGFSLGVSVSRICPFNKNIKDTGIRRITEKRLSSGAQLINPLLECEQFSGGDISLQRVEYKLKKYIKNQIEYNNATLISVYLRDLNNGPWIGINENEKFAPASLLKIPIMIAYFKAAEGNFAILEKQIKYETEAHDIPQEIPPANALIPGNTYTVSELIRNMIVYSDNISKDLLLLNIDEKLLNQVYRDLELDIPNERTPEDFISVKEYASFFRILYNSSYLSKAMSEKALELLTEVDFPEGIVAGVPSNIKVANKFGEREDNTKMKQLHDCGIVYYPGSPYLVCIMAKGTDLTRLSSVIGEISKIVYENKKQND